MSSLSIRMAAIVGSLTLFAAMCPGTSLAVTINFENLAVGTVLSSQYAASLGVTFSPNAFTGPGNSTSGEPWATNTDMTIVSSAGTDVGGLGTPVGVVSGNILRSYAGWLNEDGDASFRVAFASPVSSFSAAFAGVSTAADVRIFVYNGNTLLNSVAGTSTGQFVLSYTSPSITSVVVVPGSFDDWVGVDNITFTPAAVAPVLQSATSRTVHGTAGAFNLLLVP